MAFNALTAQAWAVLVRTVARRFPSAEEWQVAESVEDALLAYRDDPRRFDAARGVPLPCYLAMRSRGYLKNRLRGEARHRRRERTGMLGDEKFEKKTRFRVTGRVERTISIGGADEAELQRSELERRLALFEPCERALVELWLRGADSVEDWAQSLGIGHLPHMEQERAVRARKISLKRKLKNPSRKGPDGVSP